MVAHESWTIASRKRSSTTREYLGAVDDLEMLRAGRGEFTSEAEFLAFWRRQPFKVGRVVAQQLDRLFGAAPGVGARVAAGMSAPGHKLLMLQGSPLSAISLLSGAGGLDLGVEQAGVSVTAMVERDRDACATLRRNLAAAHVLEADIRELSHDDVMRAAGLGRGEADLLVGGPPCAPFSRSGYWLEQKRAGADPDADRLEHYLRMLAGCAPRAFIFENVFGLAYRRGASEPWLEHLLRGAQALGFRLLHRVLLAADYGVPQLRQRLFVVGVRDGAPALPPATHSGPHERRRYDPALIPHRTAGAAIGDLAGRPDLAEPAERVNGAYGHLLPAVPPGENYLFFTERRGHPTPLFAWRSRYWSFLLKLDPGRPAPTIQAQPGPNVGPFHWENRRLRLCEIKRLQTFPDDFEIVGSRRPPRPRSATRCPPLWPARSRPLWPAPSPARAGPPPDGSQMKSFCRGRVAGASGPLEAFTPIARNGRGRAQAIHRYARERTGAVSGCRDCQRRGRRLSPPFVGTPGAQARGHHR